jgi:hypothetical protein
MSQASPARPGVADAPTRGRWTSEPPLGMILT